MKLKATTNVRQYIKQVTAEHKKNIGRAMVIANQRAAKMAVVQVKDMISNKYTIKKSIIGKKISVKNGSYSNPDAKIKGEGKGLSLKYFKVRPTKVPNQKGIPIKKRKRTSAEVIQGERKDLGSAFLIPLGDSLGIFKRIEGAGNKIKKLLGPGIAQLLGTNKSFEVIRDTVKRNYKRLYEQAYKFSKR